LVLSQHLQAAMKTLCAEHAICSYAMSSL
jgi:hypothetical protein